MTLIDSGMIFLWDVAYYGLEGFVLLLHFLVVTSTLIVASSFYKTGHNFENLTVSSIHLHLKFKFEKTDEKRVFKLFFLSPMSFFLITDNLGMAALIDQKRKLFEMDWEGLILKMGLSCRRVKIHIVNQIVL